MHDSARPAPAGNPDITGVILAGGRARRMGGQDKGLVELNGRPMVAYVAEALRPQVGALLVNANRNLERYGRLTGCPVIPDILGDYAGPLAGMASGMDAARTLYVLTVPCDSPFVPCDLASRLLDALVRESGELAVAHDGKRLQPVFALLRRGLVASALAYLESGERKIDLWYARHRMVAVDLSDEPEAFLNVNTPEDCAAVNARLRAA